MRMTLRFRGTFDDFSRGAACAHCYIYSPTKEFPCPGVKPVSAKADLLMRPRYLFVVSRQHPSLYELLVERFEGDKNVEVILDRRASTSQPGETYQDDRRQRPQNELIQRSHLIITRPD